MHFPQIATDLHSLQLSLNRSQKRWLYLIAVSIFQILKKEIHACISKVKPRTKERIWYKHYCKCDDSLNMAVAHRLRCDEYRIIKQITFYTKRGFKGSHQIPGQLL